MKKFIKLLLLILCMTMIFYFSAQVAEQSIVQTNWLLDILHKIYSNFVEINYEVFVVNLFKPLRKLAHFCEFALLGILMYINVIDHVNRNEILYSCAFAILYAISDEVHQLFVPGRACTIIDMLIDSCGIVCGVVFIHLLLGWKKKH